MRTCLCVCVRCVGMCICWYVYPCVCLCKRMYMCMRLRKRNAHEFKYISTRDKSSHLANPYSSATYTKYISATHSVQIRRRPSHATHRPARTHSHHVQTHFSTNRATHTRARARTHARTHARIHTKNCLSNTHPHPQPHAFFHRMKAVTYHEKHWSLSSGKNLP